MISFPSAGDVNFNLLPWLLKGSNRTEFQVYIHDLSLQTSKWSLGDPGLVLCALVIIVAIRFSFNAAFTGIATRLARSYGRDAAHRDGGRLLEEVWVLIGNVVVLAVSVYIMMYHNGSCSWLSWPLDQGLEACFVDWPNHHVDSVAALYLHVEMAWYISLLLKPILKSGMRDGSDMALHHLMSVVLLLACFAFNVIRFGNVVITIFGISNPALHVAKIANQLNAPDLIRIGLFAFFALLFFLTRVVLVPFVVLFPAAVRTKEWIGYAIEELRGCYLTLNALIVMLYIMQLFWMRSIVRVLRKASHSGADAASALSSKLDPAKRYSLEHFKKA